MNFTSPVYYYALILPKNKQVKYIANRLQETVIIKNQAITRPASVNYFAGQAISGAPWYSVFELFISERVAVLFASLQLNDSTVLIS